MSNAIPSPRPDPTNDMLAQEIGDALAVLDAIRLRAHDVEGNGSRTFANRNVTEVARKKFIAALTAGLKARRELTECFASLEGRVL